ncbi:hypothetical protein [Maribacter polysaccharolyticus]|uniref:hypothetical protein n=1 Tax=Maribacter polysaccharolyticus TaxID=3020831 RepID=UPI00237FCF5D|nr:hypothetical protein [Maribacter polysaccharolyticus]MDE3744017.1 hypothetical protein [Maribacter polysaccharolyticus]
MFKPIIRLSFIATSLVVCLGVIHPIYPQDQCKNNDKVIDSLPISELASAFIYYEGPSICALQLALKLSEKAKFENDSINLSKVYAAMAYRAEKPYGLMYADSLINISQNPEDFYYYEADLIKGFVYYNQEEPLKAIRQFEKSHDLAVRSKNFEIEIRSLIWIATVKGEQTGSDESIKIYHDVLKLIKTQKWEEKDSQLKNELEGTILESFITFYINHKKPDSLDHYLQKLKDINKDIEISDPVQMNIWSGKLAMFKNQFDSALVALKKTVPYIKGQKLMDVYYNLGVIEGELGHQESKTKYFRRYDSISKLHELPPGLESKEVLIHLMEIAIQEENVSEQMEYLKSIRFVDSFITKNRKLSQIVDVPGYSIQELRNERAGLIKENENKSHLSLFLGTIITIVISILVYYYYKYRKAKSTLTDYLDNLSNSPTSTLVKKPKKNTDDIEPSIQIALHKLNAWEDNKGYRDKNVDLNELSSILKTNRTYISKAINIYKEKSFRVYITDLRIEDFITTTSENFDYKKKSINSIIQEFGFNSKDTFSRALKNKLKNNNITPSMYMDEIIKRNT